MPFSIRTIYSVIFRIWREKRYQMFLDRIQPKSNESVLDVGGEPDTWTARPQPVDRVLCVNVFEYQWNPADFPHHRVETVLGDGCNLKDADQSYPIVFSNSVIEHVGDLERQKQFAKEVRRVGQRLWIQTPAFECPLEPHFMLPLGHWMPVALRTFVVRWFSPWAWLERVDKAKVDRTIAYTQLLTRKQMLELFPDCQLLTERMFWIFPKSYIAVRTTAPSDPNHAQHAQVLQAGPQEKGQEKGDKRKDRPIHPSQHSLSDWCD